MLCYILLVRPKQHKTQTNMQQVKTNAKLQVLREHTPPPNASIIDNPVNPDFGLRTLGSGRWSGSSPKLNSLVPGPCPTPPRNFVKIRSQLFQLSDGQTDRQTNRSENITSFGGGKHTSWRRLINGHSWRWPIYCDIVCLLPHSQNVSSRMPQSAAQRPSWPVRYRLTVQSLLLRSKPGWRMVGSVIRNWLGTSCLNQSSFQASSTEQSELGIADHIGCLNNNGILLSFLSHNSAFLCTLQCLFVGFLKTSLHQWSLVPGV